MSTLPHGGPYPSYATIFHAATKNGIANDRTQTTTSTKSNRDYGRNGTNLKTFRWAMVARPCSTPQRSTHVQFLESKFNQLTRASTVLNAVKELERRHMRSLGHDRRWRCPNCYQKIINVLLATTPTRECTVDRVNPVSGFFDPLTICHEHLAKGPPKLWATFFQKGVLTQLRFSMNWFVHWRKRYDSLLHQLLVYSLCFPGVFANCQEQG